MNLLDEAAQRLRAAGVETPRKEARLLLAHVLGVDLETIIADRISPLDIKASVAFEAALKRRVAREPLAYITGRREFWSLDFTVSPGVLVPRPETETLIEAALNKFPDKDSRLDILDLGTGTGCLLLGFLYERKSAQGSGVDIGAEAIRIAVLNASKLGLAARSHFLLADWREAPAGPFDGIFCNPPYIRESDYAVLAPEVALHEPEAALFAGVDGLAAYRTIAPIIAARLKSGGLAFVELGQGQADAVVEIAQSTGLICKEIVQDLAGIPRCLVLTTVKKPLEKSPGSG